MPVSEDRLSIRPTLPGALAWLISLAVLLVLSQSNYVVFHSAAETLTIAIATGIFVLAWYSRKRMDHDFILYMGTALLFYAVISFFHMLAFKGMGIFEGDGNLGISLTVATRYLIALSLLTGVLFIKRKLWTSLAFAVYSAITVVVLLSIFVWGNFPTTYVEGTGVTLFKTVLNLCTLPLLGAAIYLLYRYRDRFDGKVFRLLVASAALHAAANVSFSFYSDAHGTLNMIGHIFQVTAFYFMFMAVVDVGLTRPQDILFRRTKESEAVAVEATRHLEHVVEQRTADLQLAKSEAEFTALQMKTIADTAADAVICIDGNMDVVFWNRAAEKIFGYPSDEAIGKPLHKFMPDANLSEYAEVIGQMGAADDTPIPGGSVQVQASQKGGAVVPLEIALSFWSLSGKRYATVVGRDMTERIRSEETLRQSAAQLAQVLRSVVETMGSAVEARDPYTQGHQRGVARVSTLIAREMGLGLAQVANIEIAALVHDIGKLAIPATILNKPGPLTELEYEMVKEHPQAGYDILKHIDFGAPIAEVVLQHHERMDGTGYPLGVSGNSILPASRVLIVADVVEAICSTRPYRAALSIDEAMAELYNNITKYDYDVVKACERLYQSGELAQALAVEGE